MSTLTADQLTAGREYTYTVTPSFKNKMLLAYSQHETMRSIQNPVAFKADKQLIVDKFTNNKSFFLTKIKPYNGGAGGSGAASIYYLKFPDGKTVTLYDFLIDALAPFTRIRYGASDLANAEVAGLLRSPAKNEGLAEEGSALDRLMGQGTLSDMVGPYLSDQYVIGDSAKPTLQKLHKKYGKGRKSHRKSRKSRKTRKH